MTAHPGFRYHLTVTEQSLVDAFVAACRGGRADKAVEVLLRIQDTSVSELVANIGGGRAMARFLCQRAHILSPLPEGGSLAQWLEAQLREAEPMHLLDVSDALAAAEASEHAEIVYRLKAHLKFVQPPDPTRWSRKFATPAQAAFLQACRDGDPERVGAALADDETLVRAINKWGQDGAALVAAYASEQAPEVIRLLVSAGLPKTALPLTTAAWWGHLPVIESLLEHGFPLHQPIDHDALWSAAVATRHNHAFADFEAVAKVLVDAGADPNCSNRWGTTAWGIADKGARSVLEALGADPQERVEGRYDRTTGCSPAMLDPDDAHGDLDINEAAAAGDRDRVRSLLTELYRHTPSVSGQGPPERPLALAAYHGHVKLAFMLISDHGYSPAARNDAYVDGQHVGPKSTWDKTAIDIAVDRGHTRLVDVLMNSVDWFQGRRARRK